MRTRPDIQTPDLAASLTRLGVRELEERMELSPLLAGGGTEAADRCTCSCECDDMPYPDDGVPPVMDDPISGKGY